MGYSQWSIDSVGVILDEEWFNCLKKDLVDPIKKKAMEDAGYYLDYTDDMSFGEYICEFEDIQQYEGGRHSENYAQYFIIDLNTGKSKSELEVFSGYFLPISWGSGSIYEPEFKNKEDLLKRIEDNLYVPTGWNLEAHVAFVTGVQGG